MIDDFGVALHELTPGATQAAASRSLWGGLAGIKRLVVEQVPRAGFAGPATRCDTGAGLQLLERARTLADRLQQALVRDSVAEANVHKSVPRRARDRRAGQIQMQMIPI
jgi:hypothetical protein